MLGLHRVMHRFIIFLFAATAVFNVARAGASPVYNATGYGRFACSTRNGDLTYSPDTSLCLNSSLIAPGVNGPANSTSGNQIDGPNPVDSKCVQQPGGGFFCGIAGATCSSDANCDNGSCVNGVCAGSFSTTCNGDDSLCLGYLYCTSASFRAVQTCGQLGAYCCDGLSSGLKAEKQQDLFNQFCQSGYCNMRTSNCASRLAAGANCSRQPYGCQIGLSCKNTFCTA